MAFKSIVEKLQTKKNDNFVSAVGKTKRTTKETRKETEHSTMATTKIGRLTGQLTKEKAKQLKALDVTGALSC